MIQDQVFREDLYYRLAAVELRVPALRERSTDIPLLAQLFLDRLNRQYRTKRKLGEEAMKTLSRHAWPGNVRELEHAVARAFLLADGDVLRDALLPEPIAGDTTSSRGSWPVMSLQEAERRTIKAALAACGGDKTKTARTLGISRTALYEKLKRMASS
jgi:two-component system response regulator HydG